MPVFLYSPRRLLAFVLLLSLALSVFFSALSVISNVHAVRTGYVELNQLYEEENRQLQQHGRLLLERSVLLNFYRLEAIAAEELGMKNPNAAQVEVLE